MLKALQNRMRDDKGFTLIELMVVVLIIAILIAIAIPTFLGMRERAQKRAAQSNLRNGLTAAKAFYTDADTFDGFDAAAAETVEASLIWVDGTVNVDIRSEVGIDDITAGDTVVLAAYSDSDDYYCISEVNGVVGYGSGAGATPDLDVASCDEPDATVGWV